MLKARFENGNNPLISSTVEIYEFELINDLDVFCTSRAVFMCKIAKKDINLLEFSPAFKNKVEIFENDNLIFTGLIFKKKYNYLSLNYFLVEFEVFSYLKILENLQNFIFSATRNYIFFN